MFLCIKAFDVNDCLKISHKNVATLLQPDKNKKESDII
jgi:hypothetical protein